MALKLFNFHLVLLLVSCSLSFDKEIINYGPILKSIDQIKIIASFLEKYIHYYLLAGSNDKFYLYLPLIF